MAPTRLPVPCGITRGGLFKTQERAMPYIIICWKELLLPEKVQIAWWEPLDALDEPHHVKVKLVGGDTVVIKRNGSEITTWRSK